MDGRAEDGNGWRVLWRWADVQTSAGVPILGSRSMAVECGPGLAFDREHLHVPVHDNNGIENTEVALPAQPDSGTVSIVLPLRDGARWVDGLVAAVRQQSVHIKEWIVLDSESGDDGPERLRAAGATVMPISRASFNHGATRNLGASATTGDVIVFMTQDAAPAAPDTIEKLVAPLFAHRASASFARQVPRDDASPTEKFSRAWNYPSTSQIVGLSDASRLGLRLIFFSNAFSAVRRDALDELGGFPEWTVTNEDMLFGARLIARGHRVAYVSEALVIHSHCLTLSNTIRRYFDIGVFFTDADDELAQYPRVPQGRQYVFALLAHLVRRRMYGWIPFAIAESLAKMLGYWLGRSYRRLPLWLSAGLSTVQGHWRSPG